MNTSEAVLRSWAVVLGGFFAFAAVALGVAFGVPGNVLGILAAVALLAALFVFRKPWIGVLFLAFFLPFERFGSFEVAGLTLRASQVFGFLTLTAFIGAGLTLRRFHFRPHPGTLPLTLFLAIALLSLAGAQNMERGALVFLFVLFTMLVHFLLPNLITNEWRLRTLLRVLFVSTGLVVLFGLFQFFGDVLGLPTSVTGLRDLYTSAVFGFPRVQSTFLEPLYFANFLLLPIGLILSYLLSPFRSERMPFLFILLSLAVLNLLLTLSRGGFFGLAVTVLVVMLYSLRKALTPTRIFFGIVLLAFVAYGFLQIFAFTGDQELFLERFVRQATDIFRGASYTDRATTFSQAFTLFRQHPWLGVGIGNFGPAVAMHPLQQPAGGWLIVNNEFLEILAETGALGFAAFLTFLAVLFFRSVALLRRAKDSFLKRTLVGAFAAFLGILVQYQTFSVLFIMHIWFAFGLLVAVQNLLERERV